jgi:hypothetical protein
MRATSERMSPPVSIACMIPASRFAMSLASAPFYNFGKDGGALHRQPRGEKQMAIPVRCISE